MGIVEDKILSTANFDFYLTGSRYFGYDSPFSDTDYMVEYSPKLIKFLEELGFEENKFPRFRNKYLVSLFKHKGENLDIQVLNGVKAKVKAQTLVKQWMQPDEIKKLLTKTELAFRLWDMLIELVNCEVMND